MLQESSGSDIVLPFVFFRPPVLLASQSYDLKNKSHIQHEQ